MNYYVVWNIALLQILLLPAIPHAGILGADPKCITSPHSGDCDIAEEKWAYSCKTNSCFLVTHGGCSNNPNRHKTRRVCEETCVKQEEWCVTLSKRDTQSSGAGVLGQSEEISGGLGIDVGGADKVGKQVVSKLKGDKGGSGEGKHKPPKHGSLPTRKPKKKSRTTTAKSHVAGKTTPKSTTGTFPNDPGKITPDSNESDEMGQVGKQDGGNTMIDKDKGTGTMQEQNKQIEAGNKKMTEENKQMKEANKQMENENKRMKEANKRIEEENKKMKAENKRIKEVSQRLQEENNKLQEENKRLEAENKPMDEAIKTLQSEKEGLGEEINKLEKENAKLKEENKRMEEDNKRLEEAGMHANDNKMMDAVIERIQEENGRLKDEIEGLEEQIAQFEEDKKQMTEEIKKMKEENKMVELEKSALQADNQKVRGAAKQMQDVIKKMQEAIIRMQEERKLFENEIKRLRAHIKLMEEVIKQVEESQLAEAGKKVMEGGKNEENEENTENDLGPKESSSSSTEEGDISESIELSGEEE